MKKQTWKEFKEGCNNKRIKKRHSLVKLFKDEVFCELTFSIYLRRNLHCYFKKNCPEFKKLPDAPADDYRDDRR